MKQLSIYLRHSMPVLVMLVAMILGSGCSLLRKGAGAMMTPMAGDLAKSLQHQQDYDLVEEGAPTYLLLLDGLVESSPDNPDLLLAASSAQTAYAAAFLDKSEAARARIMYGKARDYGLRILCRNKKFKKVQDQPVDVFKSALPSFRQKDVPALYATATAWTGWIINSGSVEAIAQFPKAMALMERVMELDPSYQKGGPDMYFGVYYAVQPLGAGRDLEKSKAHFEKAMEYAGPDYLLPRVAFAEYYARYAFDQELFEKTLNGVLDQNVDTPDFRLMNEAARRRATALLERMDDLF
jgi:tetratricopeptide (TPR) repeat protein